PAFLKHDLPASLGLCKCLGKRALVVVKRSRRSLLPAEFEIDANQLAKDFQIQRRIARRQEIRQIGLTALRPGGLKVFNIGVEVRGAAIISSGFDGFSTWECHHGSRFSTAVRFAASTPVGLWRLEGFAQRCVWTAGDAERSLPRCMTADVGPRFVAAAL